MSRLRSLSPALVGTALVLAAFGAFREVLAFGFLGHDTFPILASSRLSEPGDLWRIFTTQLMDGRFRADFYRPVLELSFALDWALHGLDPRGYQLTNLACFALAVASIYHLVRRLSGKETLLAPALAGLVFLMHPSHWEVLPVAARRSAPLGLAFTALCLASLLHPDVLAGKRRPRAAPLFALLAMATKESAFVLVPLAPLALWLCLRPRLGARPALSRALSLAAPLLALSAGFFLLRYLVLGGLGGYEGSGPANLLRGWPVDPALLLPPDAFQSALARWALLGGLCLCLAGMFSEAPSERGRENGPGLLVACAWLVGAALLIAWSGLRHPWYLTDPTGALALIAGLSAGRLAGRLRAERGLRRAPAALGLAALAGLLCWQASYAAPLRDYREWPQASARLTKYLSALERRLPNARPGTSLVTQPLPMYEPPAQGVPAVRGAAILSHYSLEAYCELAYPGRKLRVCTPQDPRDGGGGDSTNIVVPLPPGALESRWKAHRSNR